MISHRSLGTSQRQCHRTLVSYNLAAKLAVVVADAFVFR